MYKIGVLFEINFEIKKIIFYNDNDNFAIVKAKIMKHTSEDALPQEMTIQGFFPSVYTGDVFKGIGEIKLHQIYGHYVNLKECPIATLPQIKKGLVEFIKKRVRGLGKKTAGAIVDELGLDAISLIEKDYKVLVGIGRISEKRAKKIHDKLVEHKKFEEVATFIQSLKMETVVAIRIYEKFKDTSIIKVRQNPYIIATIPKLDFIHADRIACALNFPSDNYERVKCAIQYYIDYKMKSYGDICIIKDKMLERFNEFLIKLGAYSIKQSINIEVDIIEKAIKDLVSKGYIVTEINDDGDTCIYRTDYNIIENNIIKGLKKLLDTSKKPFCMTSQIDEFIKEYEAKYLTLADRQTESVYVSIQNGISILTGGPGTGKTQTTNTIVQCIKHIKPNATITLLAPTGKASRRMTELTQMEASTIHRGIGLNGFVEYQNIEEINSDFVIIDESSMIDAYVFNILISKISENTRVLFVGDHEQLPSVGPGLILRDLINSGKIPVVKLDKIFRQAEESQIVTNSHKIIKGIKNGITFDISKGDFYFIERKNKLNVRTTLIQCIENMIKNQGYKLSEICLLSPMRKGDLGTDELNRAIQSKFNPPSNKPDYYKDEMNCFRVGDRVMQTANNYDFKVFNGDVGTITSIYTDEGEYVVEVDYPNKNCPIKYTENDFDEIELAYAITIHKSQGSEFPVVIMPIFETQMSMLNRNLIYTALTRAKEKVVCVGSIKTLYKAIDKVDDIKRTSRIKEKIIHAL